MKPDLPSPSDILEELADGVIAEIDKLATTSFKTALNEMVRYHQFLLEAYASKDERGVPFSYAEVEASWFGKPYQEWLHEYRRIFERAVDRIREETDFVSILARLPIQLLPPRTNNFSPATISAILDLGPMLVSRLENWMTKHVTLDVQNSHSASPRLSLSGSDRTAFTEVLFEVIGGWERTLELVGALYEWNQSQSRSAAERWTRYSNSWIFLKQHLHNTAYFVALAAWNEDELGSERFTDALVRWPKVFEFELPDRYHSLHPTLLSPEIFKSDWPTVQVRLANIEGNQAIAGEASPSQLASTIFDSAHADILLVTSAVILRWSIEQKLTSAVAIQTVQRILKRELADDDELSERTAVSFRSLFFGIARLYAADGQFSEEGYGASLDGIARTIDQMSERRVVPGRIFTPSTINGRDGLLLPWALMLISTLPDEGDGGVITNLIDLISNVSTFADRDRSIAAVSRFLQQMIEVIKPPHEKAIRAINLLSPQTNFFAGRERLEVILQGAKRAIEEKRTDRIRALPFDQKKISELSQAVEAALLEYPAEVHFFEGFKVQKSGSPRKGQIIEQKITGLPKGAYTTPVIDRSWADLDDNLVSRIEHWAAGLVWRSFWSQGRLEIFAPAGPLKRDFWLLVAQEALAIGPSAALLLPLRVDQRAVREWAREPDKRPPGLRYEKRLEGSPNRYVATIEGVDVYLADLQSGQPTLISSKALKMILYRPVRTDGAIVDLEFLTEEDPWKATARIKISQYLRWNNFPIIEFKVATE